MKRCIFLFLFFIGIMFPISCFALDFPAHNSKNVLIFDKTDNNILYSYKSDEVKSIASLTKIVTTIVAIEKINNLDDEVVITSDMIYSVDPIASKAGLRVDDRVTYRDLLYASILPSGADATNSLAILLSGSIENFVNDMNSFANKIGVNNTHFVNVTGLDVDNHYSSADDILKIISYSLDNDLFYDIFTTKKYTLSNGLEVKSTLYKYFGDDIQQIEGSKTGFTGNAGYCIATLSNTDGHEIIIVLLDAEHKDDDYYNIIDSVKFIDFINNNYSNTLLMKKNSIITKLNINLCVDDFYDVKAGSDIYKFLPSDYDDNLFKYRFSGKDKLTYRDKKGDKIGKVVYYYDNEIIFEEDIILSKDMKIDYFKVIKEYLFYEIIFVLVIIFIIVYIIWSRQKVKLKD